MLSIPSISREYLHVPVSGGDDSMPVEIAIVDRGTEPAEDDWLTAGWNPDVAGEARLLIGEGSPVELEDGTYDVWVRVTATPERPALKAGSLRVT